MGKNKRQRLASVPKGRKPIKPLSKAKNPPNQNTKSKAKPHTQTAHLLPTIPFRAHHRILLIGEGDLSFALSLLQHHKCKDVTATVLEPSREVLEEKYPHVGAIAETIQELGGNVVFGVDVKKMGIWWTQGMEGRATRKGGMDRIFFNFPHVGGKSTDVNRQVRYNQELLVAFFKRALPSLAPGGSIIVTLFEGEPYTLWNIRDLGRHSGLQVETSFKFQSSAYPGYHHARTLGAVRSKNGEVGGGWKGEERAARSYVFVRKGEGSADKVVNFKRKRGGSSDDEDEDEDEVEGLAELIEREETEQGREEDEDEHQDDEDGRSEGSNDDADGKEDSD